MLRQDEMHKKIVVRDVNPSNFYECVIPEYNGLNAKRFSYKVEVCESEVTFNVTAMDPTAMKAAESSIRKLESVFKKMNYISGGENV